MISPAPWEDILPQICWLSRASMVPRQIRLVSLSHVTGRACLSLVCRAGLILGANKRQGTCLLEEKVQH